nr:hypothetical protein [Tanacetum cinerariifolium]
PDFVPEPIYPEYIPLEDEHILPAKEQPLSPVASPTAESPGYVAESYPEEDPEEYKEDEAEDGPVDYPMEGGDDGDDDDDGNSSGYDVDDEDEDNEDEEEEEEHLALADSVVVIPIDELDGRTRISQRVAMDSQRVDLLMGDIMTLQETVCIMEEEAYAASEAWAQLVGLNQTAHHELYTLREQVYAQEYQLQAHLPLQSTLIQTQQQLHETHSQMQQTEMAGLRETDRMRQS